MSLQCSRTAENAGATCGKCQRILGVRQVIGAYWLEAQVTLTEVDILTLTGEGFYLRVGGQVSVLD